ncbi:MAG: CARDB domain-containing protein [Caldilineaceae bacterium]
MAERWELGLNMNAESTDRDKFDDGQELFGATEWGRGALPRVQDDAGYIFAEMPTWVKAPGNHPFVAAFPVPEIDVVASSLKVETVTTVTTDHVISEGTEKSYSTAKTEGTSTSVANTETWNNWQETSESVQERVIRSERTTLDVKSWWESWKQKRLETKKYKQAKKTAEKGCKFKDGGSWSFDLKPEGVGVGYQTGQKHTSSLLTDSRCAGAMREARTLGSDKWNKEYPDLTQNASGPNIYNNVDVRFDPLNVVNLQNQVVLNNNFDTDNIVAGIAGLQYSYAQTGELLADSLYEISYALNTPVKTTTETSGQSWGGSQTVTTGQYEEHTVTNGEAFSNGESWGNATAADSAHAADLWFTYKVRNTGTEYARQIGNLAFNVYIGDPSTGSGQETPAYTYFVAPDIGGDGMFHNFMPAEEHTYTSRRIPLSLEQMKAIDLGGPLSVVVEDFTYGIDELFYQDAANAGLLIAIEDGTDDGNEAIDSYLLPTWGEESVVDVLARYFPHTADENGTVIAIWTPEYRSDTPAWCAEPKIVGIGGQRTLWCKHALSTADWWNVYTNGLGDGSEGFQDTPASPGAVALFRFNKDSDLDGYSDRSEVRLGTNPNDPGDFPRPELLAGMHSIRSGDKVTATLSLLNTGLYDAYGVEAVLIAPDDSVSITNNTVGGSGRVRAQKQVIVGSRILMQTPLPTAWTQAGHAIPAAGGYYTGGADRTYTFGVVCGNSGGCSVGSGAWSVNWSDSKGITGTLSYGDNYASPSFLPVGAFGLTLALHSGTVADGESFTVAARTPRDTFQYTINREPFTEPLVIVSYNDPQGNHRFILPPAAAHLTSPSDNLVAFAGQMLDDVGVEIVTTEAYSGGAASTRLLVNNPSETALTGAHVFLEFINISGTVVSEVTTQVNLPPGPTTAEVAWDSAGFSPAYNADEDYIVMAFLTDYEGNILDTAGRPLSSFQDDPRPAAALDNGAQVWDFGAAQQGTLIEHPFALASVGYLDLLAYLGNAPGLSVDGPAATSISPGDVALYTVQLNTESLPVGAFEATIPVRTSDPQNPAASLTIRGTITPMPADAPGGAVLRPLDVDAAIPGDHAAGEWVTFSHNLGPDPQSLHPVKVYSQDYGTLHGVGKYATDFGAGTASYAMFGDGRDGVMPGSGNLDNANGFAAGSVNGTAGATSISVTDRHAIARVNPGDVVLIHQTRGIGAGQWELNNAAADFTGSSAFALQKPLKYSYVSNGGNEKAQILRVPQYSTCNVTGTVTPLAAWNGDWGGIFAVMCQNGMTISGTVTADYLGFRGNLSISNAAAQGFRGEGHSGSNQVQSPTSVDSGGGGGPWAGSAELCCEGTGGGGGGNGTPGERGYRDGDSGRGQYGGYGGSASGNAELSVMTFGGSGGEAYGHPNNGGQGVIGGKRGGGIIAIFVRELNISGQITSKGESTSTSTYYANRGGAGAGGSVLVKGETITIGGSGVNVSGGVSDKFTSGGDTAWGGAGGVGRIRVEYCDTLTGTTNPPASTQKLNCYIAEQVETAPYDTARLNLPETFSGGRTYKVQYGRRLQFAAASEQTTTIRLPKQLYSDATLDALVNNTGVASSPFALSIDFGNDGTADWTHSGTTSFPATLNVTGTVDALNAYLVSRDDIAWGGEVDVPVRVISDRQADVLLTNLVLRLQVNQPTARAAEVEIAADRPLDWPLQVAGNYSQGTAYDFTHTLGPDPATLHPCTVYDQSGKVLKGVGKYCTDLGQGTASYEMFGDGRDGAMPGSGNLDYDNGFAAGSVNGTAGATSISVIDRSKIYRVNPGDVVLIHQSRGSGAGQWELNKAAADFTGSGTFALQKPLKYSYVSNGGNEKAQILRVPQYSTCNVTGTVTPLAAWNGDWGGIFAVMCKDIMTVSGAINANRTGFRGGIFGDLDTRHHTGQQGESYPGTGIYSTQRLQFGHAQPNGGGGGGGGETAGSSGPGGGGGYGTVGQPGGSGGLVPGLGGNTYGDAALSQIHLGSGGGGTFLNYACCASAADGGDGGGIVLIVSRALNVSGTISSDGENGARGTGGEGSGGGSGGSIKIVAAEALFGTNGVLARGRVGGDSHYWALGGNGGVGRIRIEYCNSANGSTNPPTTPVRIDCYAAEQLAAAPYTTTRLYLPDAVSGSQSYLVQYARRFVFAASGQQTSSLRLNRRVYGGAALDLLVSNAGAATGNLALCLDLGNDGVCDYTHSGSTNFPATLEASGLAEALNNYLLGRNDIPWGAPVDVPVRLTLDRQADVMLTNLALTPLGAKTRFVRLEARTYSTATLGLEFRQPGVPSGPLAFTVDVGADGSVDWSYAGTPNFPARLTSPNLAAAVSAYLAGRSGEVDVPIRIVPSPFLELSLTDFDADPADRPDLIPQTPTASAARSGAPIVEGDTVPLTALIQNGGTADSGPIAVTFYAARSTQYFYIGTAFVANVPKAGSSPATIQWNTLGFPGDTTVRAVVDPFNRTRESNEANNSAEALIPIRTRPDLRVTAIQLSNPLLMAGETVTVTLTLSNSGQTAAGSQTVALYNANPDSGGAVVETQNLASLPGETQTTIQFPWTPTAPGPYRLFSLSDRDSAVNESDEGNNRTWQDVYVGLAAPVLLDSGPGEPVYASVTGYGVVDEGQPDVTSAPCGSGATVEETQRLDFDGRVVYRFDHLLPGRYYHLDVTLYECTGAGRQESIYIDGNLVDGPVNLGDGEVHHRSILIDPALYADHSVEVSIESPGVNGAIVSAVNLHAVDYRYADSGGTNDPDYTTAQGYGALNGVRNSAWGRLPYQSVRVNQTGRSVDYRYDGLAADKFYQLHLSFYQTGDTSRTQQVEIDGKLAGAEISLPNDQKQRISLPVPTGTYTDDGSISVSVVRVNANVGAIVNEIALEEVTVPTAVCGVTPTPYWTYAYGSVTIEGAPALPGTVVTAENENGDVVGCYRVEQAGFYSFMPIFGASDPTPGMAEGQQVKFRVNGQLAVAIPTLSWTNDKDIHRIDLTISGIESQWIRLNPGWTLFSLRVEPPVTSLTDVLKPVEAIYCDVHGENDVYDCDLPPQAQALTELHGGRAYYIRNDSGATANLFVQGAPITSTWPIPLHTDWNWVGYLLQESMPVADALASIAGKYTRVADGKARLYKPDQPQFSTLSQMVPDDGYLIFMTDAATLVYPAPLVAAESEPMAVREVCGDVSPTPAFTWLYGELLVNGQPAALGSRVDVFTPRGELAGCFTVDSAGLYGFLPVYGADNGNPPLPGFADGEVMTLRVNGQVVELAEPLRWRNDKQERRVDLSATVAERRFFLPLIGRPAQVHRADAEMPLYLPLMGR